MPNCSKEDCDRSFDKNHMPEASAVQLGWGCHNNKWICPEHLAEHDAPAVAAAEKQDEPRSTDPQDTEPSPAPDRLDSEG